MIRLQYFNCKEWVTVSEWGNVHIAWSSIANDYVGYRTIDDDGNVCIMADNGIFRYNINKKQGVTFTEK